MAATEQQQAVIDRHSGVTLVQACPGSGKTTTLVNRCKAIPANQTKLVLAFNKKAAEEFASRMGQVSGADVRTFHSFCLREVFGSPSNFGYKTKPMLVDKDRTLLSQLCEANGRANIKSWDDTGWDQDTVQSAEHSLYSSDLQGLAREEGEFQSTYQALKKYREWLLSKSLLTFDSMVRVVAENADRIKRAAEHVMVDEYQDVDRFQFDITTAIARKNVRSFAVVGDPNQRIYEWRGALSDAFHSMRSQFDEALTLPMTINFRSFDPILAHAEEICSVGMTGVRGAGSGEVVRYGGLVQLQEGYTGALADLAILCRYNRECVRWQIQLARQGIPVYMLGGGDFWRLKHIRLANEAWDMERGIEWIMEHRDWQKMMKQRRFIDNEDLVNEVMDDVQFVLNLSREEMSILKRNLQSEAGLKISTIHRTKGMEFERVMVSGVTERLKDETFVYYVACTRARDKMVLA